MKPIKKTVKPVDIFDVANYFISLSQKTEIDKGVYEGITHLKLQKLLYFAQAAYLSIYDTELFENEIQAWDFGPVIPVIYQKYKTFGNSLLDLPTDYTNSLSKEITYFLDGIWEMFAKYSAVELINITHEHKPWKVAFKAGMNNIIEKSAMQEYYKNIFEFQEDEFDKAKA